MQSTLSITRLSGFGRGKSESFADSSLTLGTDGNCHVRFDATWDKTVSPQHARLTLQSDGWWIEDCSKDGCWIEGRRVARQKLNSGVTLEMGKGGPRIQLDFTPVSPSPASPIAPVASAPPAAASRAAPPAISTATPLPAKSNGLPIGIIAACAVALVGMALFVAFGRKSPTPSPTPGGSSAAPVAALPATAPTAVAISPPKETDQMIAEAAKAFEDAVGLVVYVGERNGQPVSQPSATAWAVGDRVFASNSHVTQTAKEYLAKGVAVFIILNRNPDRKFRVARAEVHPKYDQRLLNIDGKTPAVPPYDVGLLYVEGKVPKKFSIASESELHKLDSGYRVAYLGFPMERMSGGGVDFRNPVANMQSGIVTSVSDYWLSKASYGDALLVSHNLGATGGASGSPVFNARGEVVAILSAGNIVGQVVQNENSKEVNVVRAPSAVMINFAQRIDILRDIYPDYPQ